MNTGRYELYLFLVVSNSVKGVGNITFLVLNAQIIKETTVF